MVTRALATYQGKGPLITSRLTTQPQPSVYDSVYDSPLQALSAPRAHSTEFKHIEHYSSGLYLSQPERDQLHFKRKTKADGYQWSKVYLRRHNGMIT